MFIDDAPCRTPSYGLKPQPYSTSSLPYHGSKIQDPRKMNPMTASTNNVPFKQGPSAPTTFSVNDNRSSMPPVSLRADQHFSSELESDVIAIVTISELRSSASTAWRDACWYCSAANSRQASKDFEYCKLENPMIIMIICFLVHKAERRRGKSAGPLKGTVWSTGSWTEN